MGVPATITGVTAVAEPVELPKLVTSLGPVAVKVTAFPTLAPD